MNKISFEALVVSKAENGKYTREVKQQTTDDLPKGDVLVKVSYSSLNYKDALSAIGNKGVTKNYPHTPGVDVAGTIEYSSDNKFKVGEKVIVHGYDLGMDTAGGFGQYIRVPSGWVLRLPDGLTLKESMCFGTAGFTAAYSLLQLQQHGVNPDSGNILVTGATGGVGSMAVALLANVGYKVVASTGKTDKKDFLTDLGAIQVISRNDSVDESGKLLLRSLWAGVIDTVGGNILATAIKSTMQRGTVTTCGNVGGHELSTNVYPFILRGINLVGIDSASCPMEKRIEVWNKMSNEWKLDNLEKTIKEVSLENLSNEIDLILEGKQVGRVLVDLWQ